MNLLASTGWGGAERLACTIFRMAREAGHVVRLDAVGSDASATRLRAELGADPDALLDNATLLGWAHRARARIRAFAPDLVHAHLASPSLASSVSAIAGDRPLVITFHLLPKADQWPNDRLLKVRSLRLIRWLRHYSSRRILTAVSAGDRDRLALSFPRDRVRLVLNAPPLPPVVGEQARPLDWPHGSIRLLSIARLDEQKGLDRAARALAAANLRVLPWHWIIIGEGDAHATLAQQLGELGLSERVTFTGARPAHDVIASAELVLAPSVWEGMPLVPLEAIMNGVPVVGSPIPPHQELFGGISGALLPSDEALWPAALERLIASDSARAELGRSQATLLPLLGRERMWREYETVYRECSTL
jgi:glycosyltransferase involved in cell wall biosynthesis